MRFYVYSRGTVVEHSVDYQSMFFNQSNEDEEMNKKRDKGCWRRRTRR